jgi:U3 small nucleolar RNA-associated protein 15
MRRARLPSQSVVAAITAHTDTIRSGQVSTTNPQPILTGSCDGTVRFFHSQTSECELVMESISGSTVPVEQVLMCDFHWARTVALSAAVSILGVWDLVGGGQRLCALSNHQKMVTSLALNANISRLLTGGDMVKVYDTSNYNRRSHHALFGPDNMSRAIGMSGLRCRAKRWCSHLTICDIAR